jgi:hypothetical protein
VEVFAHRLVDAAEGAAPCVWRPCVVIFRMSELAMVGPGRSPGAPCGRRDVTCTPKCACDRAAAHAGVPCKIRRLAPRRPAVDLKVPITISDELSDEVVASTGLLNLASGEIHRVEYQDYDADEAGLPWEREDYEFTSGMLSNEGKDVEFRIDVNRTTGQYSVSPSELLEIKVRAAALFAGVSGRDLLASAEGRVAAPAPIKRGPGGSGHLH